MLRCAYGPALRATARIFQGQQADCERLFIALRELEETQISNQSSSGRTYDAIPLADKLESQDGSAGFDAKWA